MLNFDLPVLNEIETIKGFEQSQEDGISKRLKNRKALMEIANEATAAGQSLDTESWAQQAKSILGPAAFLSTTSPSADALEAMRASQNKAAEVQAEKMRREQFIADDSQRKSIESAAKEMLLSEDDPSKVYADIAKTYGPDVAERLQPKLMAMQRAARHEARKAGFDFGSMFRTTGEAKKYFDDNKGAVSAAEQQGMLDSARRNEMAIEKQVRDAAESVGNISWQGNNADMNGMRNKIRSIFPDADKEYEEKLLQQASSIAAATFQAKTDAAQIASNQSIRTKIGTDAPAEAARQVTLEKDERAETEKRATALVTKYSTEEATQRGIASNYIPKDGKYAKGVDPDTAIKIASGLQSHIFENPQAYVDAVEAKDTAKVAALVAKAMPISQYRARAQALSEGVTRRFRNPDELLFHVEGSGLGTSQQTWVDRGKTMKSYAATAASEVQKSTSNLRGEASYDAAGNYTGIDTETPATVIMLNSEQAQAARVNLEGMRQQFLNATADEIKLMREVLRQNQSVAISASDLALREQRTASTKAAALLKGMDITDPSAISTLASAILEIAGPAQDITYVPTLVENYKNRVNEINGQNGLDPRTSVLPGSAIPSPRAAKNW